MAPPRLLPCEICGGVGAIPFETGPAVEACTACSGTGRWYPDPEWRGAFEAIVAERGVQLPPETRLLLEALRALERRVANIERER